MVLYVVALVAVCYIAYKCITASPCGKEEPATADEIEWFYGG